MNKPAVALGLATCALLALTAHLGLLSVQRERQIERLTNRLEQVVEQSRANPEVDAAVQPFNDEPVTHKAARIAKSSTECSSDEINPSEGVEVHVTQRQLLANPEYRSARLESEKHNFWLMNAEAINELGLSEAVAERLMTLLAEHNLRSIEGFFGPPEVPATTRIKDQSASQMRRQVRQQSKEAEIQAVLGERYADWKQFHKSIGVRREVDLLDGALAASGEPLREEQKHALIGVLMQEEQRLSTEGPEHPLSSWAKPRTEDHMDMLRASVERVAAYNDRVRRAASAHLNSAQLEVLAEALDRKLAREEAVLRLEIARRQVQGAQGL
jgi:hypothetical protein